MVGSIVATVVAPVAGLVVGLGAMVLEVRSDSRQEEAVEEGRGLDSPVLLMRQKSHHQSP